MFGQLAVAYLFLGGAGAAASLVLSVLALCIPRDSSEAFLRGSLDSGKSTVYRRFFATGSCAALCSLVFGVLCLFFDLGRPAYALMVLAQPTSSIVSLGACALVVAIVLGVLAAGLWSRAFSVPPTFFRCLMFASIAVNAFVVTYTAILLGTMNSVPLWSNGWVPVIFVISSASCGIALVVGSVQVSGAGRAFGTVLARLMRFDAALIGLELVVILAFLFVSAPALFPAGFDGASAAAGLSGASAAVSLGGASSADAASLTFAESLAANPIDRAEGLSLQLLALGSNAPLLWGGVILVGLLVPLAIELAMMCSIHKSGGRAVPFSWSMAMVVSSFCILVGGFLLRWCIVFAGVSPAALLGA